MAIKNDGLIRGKHIGNGLTTDETRKKIDVAVDGITVTFTSDGKLQASDVTQAELDAVDAKVASLTAANTALAARLEAIENDIVTLWDASGTVKLGRILKAK